jgi:hypothetical protein
VGQLHAPITFLGGQEAVWAPERFGFCGEEISTFTLNGSLSPALPVASWSLSCPGSFRLHVDIALGWVRLGFEVQLYIGLTLVVCSRLEVNLNNNNNNNKRCAKGSGKEVKIQEFMYRDTTNVEP